MIKTKIINHQPPTTNYPPPNNRAFTIIELIISIAIISIFLSLSFVGYVILNQRQVLLSSGQSLKNLIRDAQSRTANNEIDCNLCTNPPSANCSSAKSTSFNGWTVDFSNKRIYGSCGVTPTIYSIVPFNLSPDIIITPYITPVTQLNYKNNPLSVSSKAKICLSNTNIGLSTYYAINVNNTGSVSDDGGLVGTCSP